MVPSRSGAMTPADRRSRAAYVVLTHRDWPQASRLVRAILSSSPRAFVVVAHDGRVERAGEPIDDPRVEVFEHGLAADWGSWELVEATLRAFDLARRRADPDLICLVSGQDYPIRRLEAWEDELLHAGGWVGRAEALSYKPHWGSRAGEGDDTLTRYEYRWVRSLGSRLGFETPAPLRPFVRRARGAIARYLAPVFGVRIVTRGRGLHYGFRRIRSPFSQARPCYYGSQWVAMTRPELDALLDADLAPGSSLRRVYRRSIIPDESALVTPLSWRSPPNGLPPVSRVVWDSAAGRPTTRTLDDLDELVDSGSPFCRKVEPTDSAELLDALDALIATPGVAEPG